MFQFGAIPEAWAPLPAVLSALGGLWQHLNLSVWKLVLEWRGGADCSFLGSLTL